MAVHLLRANEIECCELMAIEFHLGVVVVCLQVTLCSLYVIKSKNMGLTQSEKNKAKYQPDSGTDFFLCLLGGLVGSSAGERV